jgi:alpha-galactosidase
MTLWAIFPSPLMIGGDLTRADSWMTSLLTNHEVIEMDQHSRGNHPAISTDKIVVWTAESSSGGSYVAVFNISGSSQDVQYAWKDLGLSKSQYSTRDLWEHKSLGVLDSLSVKLPSHAAALYKMSTAK